MLGRMAHEMTPEDARSALSDAAASADRLRARARWASTKMLVFGVGIALVTLAVGLVESTVLGLTVFAVWGALVLAMSRWERRRAAHLPGTGERVRPLWALSLMLYAVSIAAGTTNDGDLTYWGPAAVVVALPLLVGAVRERRA